MYIYSQVKKTCPCGGSNSNCYRCGGLGVYNAQMQEYVPEENNDRDTISTSQKNKR